jgi:hypothetical protein
MAEQAFREFQARLAQFVSMLDGELPKGVATLERMMASLDRYFMVEAPAALRETVEAIGSERQSMAAAGQDVDEAGPQEAEHPDSPATPGAVVEMSSEPPEWPVQEER